VHQYCIVINSEHELSVSNI